MPESFDLAAYLTRIGLPEREGLRPDAATLSAILAAHTATIPFESLDPFLGRPVSLDLTDLQAKLIHNRRGGYCFEHNTLLRAALGAIGYQVTSLGGRVVWNAAPGAAPSPRTHMLLLVDRPDGPVLADAGFGACLMDAPLRLVPGIEQPTSMGRFRITQSGPDHTLAAYQPTGWRSMYVFDLSPQHDADYLMGNWFTSTCPASLFHTTLIMERLHAGQRHKLVNRRYDIEGPNGAPLAQHHITGAANLARILDEVFGITPPVPTEAIFARLSKP